MALLLWLDPVGEVLDKLGQLDPLWLIAAAGFELASCLSYVAVFRRVFEPASGRSVGKLAWLGLGAGAVLPGGDVAGIAASCVALHRDGAPSRWLVVRSTVLFLLVSGVSVAATGLAGALLLSDAAAGPRDMLAAGLPLLVSAMILGTVVALPGAVRRFGAGLPGWVVGLANVVGEAGQMLRRPDRRLLGAVGYPLLDMAALWAACAATGHPPSVVALIVAYNIGYLASVVPVPAGIGVLDGGLAAALILYGPRPQQRSRRSSPTTRSRCGCRLSAGSWPRLSCTARAGCAQLGSPARPETSLCGWHVLRVNGRDTARGGSGRRSAQHGARRGAAVAVVAQSLPGPPESGGGLSGGPVCARPRAAESLSVMATTTPIPRARRWARLGRRCRSGGADGNEILTSAAAVVLIGLLVAEWITVVHMQGLLSAHMFIGLVLIPPVVLKLGSTGYRMVNYYAGSRAYRRLGPPVLPLRLMAPIFAASTIALFVSGWLLLALGHKSNVLVTIHKLSAIAFRVTLAVHFLAYIARVVRSLRTDWAAARRQTVPGAGLRAMLVAAALGGGVALALALLPSINAYGH